MTTRASDPGASLRLAVCEAPAELDPDGESWRTFAGQVRSAHADIVLLDEMPFGRWIATCTTPDETTLVQSARDHEAGLARLAELETPVVLGTRPVRDAGGWVNQAFVWERGKDAVPVHTKQFFPDEAGYHEARWFARGQTHFRTIDVAGARIGFLICTEVMFNEWARWYGRQGADLIVVPRVTPRPSTRRWRTAMSMAAIVSGAWVASSNRSGTDAAGQEFGGAGWIVDPEGDVVVETSPESPVVAAEVHVARARQARSAYPCYVAELPEPPGEGPGSHPA